MFGSACVEFFFIENFLNELFTLFQTNKGFTGLVVASAITILTGFIFFLIGFKSPKNVGLREAYTVVGVVWIFFSFFGMLPMLLSGVSSNVTDAFFESMSGFTTTGSSIISDVESLPHSLLMWRSVTEWLGGMGIVVLSLAVLPFLGVSPQLLSAEAAGSPIYNKIAPRIKDTARRIWGMYALLTFILAMLLYFEGMSVFDAINHSFTTMASGGYSTKNASIGYWNSSTMHYTITLFMIITGINFTCLYFAIFQQKFSKLFKDEEFKTFILIIVISTLIIIIVNTLTISPIKNIYDLEKNFRESIFETVSIISTTGFVINGDPLWTDFTLFLCILLMFSGACAGSTTGGIKVIRILITFKNCFYELRRLLHPNAVLPLKINNKVVQNSIVMNVYAFMLLFCVFLVLGIFALMINGMTISKAFVVTLSSICNNCAPIGNFALTPASKWILSFLMLVGRLEFFTIVLLFSKDLWRK
jgi:trk system potassium uptake protein TrkH